MVITINIKRIQYLLDISYYLAERMNKKLSCQKVILQAQHFFSSDSGIRKLRDRNSKESLVKGTENLQLNTFTKVFLSYKYNCSTYLIECNPLNKSVHLQTTGHCFCIAMCILRSARKAASIYFS